MSLIQKFSLIRAVFKIEFWNFLRLSLKYEPSQTPTLRKRHTEHSVTPIFYASTSATTSAINPALRGSKSSEDLMTLEELMMREGGGDFDSESPFRPEQRNSLLRRSFNTGSSSSSSSRKVSSPNVAASAALRPGRHKLSVPSLREPSRGEDFKSSSVEVRKTTTLPGSLRGGEAAAAAVASGKFLVPPSSSESNTAEWALSKPRSASDWAGNSPSVDGGGGGNQRQLPSSPISKAKREERGHAKSHSLGSKSR